MEFHEPVFKEEVVNFLASSRRRAIYLDCNLGGGGHAHSILLNSHVDSLLIGVDLDTYAINFSTKILDKFGSRVIFINDNFSNIDKILLDLGIEAVDGILMDLGLSSYQIDEASYGFSFDNDGPLDMRMNKAQKISAFELINSESPEKLLRILYRYGEEKYSGLIVKAIVDARKHGEVKTTGELKEIILGAAPKKGLKPVKTLSRVFQAIRIAVNEELSNLELFLRKIPKVLNEDGKIAVISYHSLEDGIVKKNFVNYSGKCICPPGMPKCGCNPVKVLNILDKKGITPGKEEIEKNPRAKSARLRRAIKCC
ncbi:MAG: 16S rRNA (cytosine(1402)-N(4))-methyltransferase RsmH [Pseudomonadota bacterium]